MKVYLSGPMTGIESWNFPAFHSEAARLREMGHEVVSPAEVNPDTSMTWEQCLRTDIKALCDCEAIALMNGWEHSKGAHLELHIAHRIGLKVLLCLEGDDKPNEWLCGAMKRPDVPVGETRELGMEELMPQERESLFGELQGAL